VTTHLSVADTLAAAFAHVDAGRIDAARPLARTLAKRTPAPPGLAYLEGLIALADGDGAKAARHLAHALAATPDAPPLLLAMARAQKAQRRDAEAETFYRRLLALAPEAMAGRIELAALLLTRGIARRDAGESAEAAALFAEAAALDPDSILAHSLLGRIRETLGEREAAIAAHARVLELDPTDRYGSAIALARLGAAPVPAKATDAFLRGLFDEYADKFDAELLVRLQYRAPDLLAGAIRRALGIGPFDAFDAGCGTGLMGAALRPLARTLSGADISPRMVERARERGVYDRLAVGDLVALLGAAADRYDLVTAADVLVYTGDLAPIFAATAVALRPGGGFAFTVERGTEGTWTLQQSGRFAHSAGYLKALAAAHGFAVLLLEETSTRLEHSVAVPGLVCVMGKHA